MDFFTPEEPRFFPEPLLGIVEKTITSTQPGRVKCKGTFWPARIYQSNNQSAILPNQTVTIVGIEGITLLVVALNN